MKMRNVEDIESFIEAVDTCEKDVFLKSQYGDVYNLKSKLSQYLGIAALLGKHGDELELFCSTKADEARMLNFLNKHPNIVGI